MRTVSRRSGYEKPPRLFGDLSRHLLIDVPR
jgi:hypothetical protein